MILYLRISLLSSLPSQPVRREVNASWSPPLCKERQGSILGLGTTASFHVPLRNCLCSLSRDVRVLIDL